MKKLLLSGVMALVMVSSFQSRVDAGIISAAERVCVATTVGLASSYLLWVQTMGGLSYAEKYLHSKLSTLTGATLFSVPESLECQNFHGKILRGEACQKFLTEVLHVSVHAGYIVTSALVGGFAAYIALKYVQNRIAK